MRPYVPPSTHPFSVNLYLSLIRVMVGGTGASCSTQGRNTYLSCVPQENPETTGRTFGLDKEARAVFLRGTCANQPNPPPPQPCIKGKPL